MSAALGATVRAAVLLAPGEIEVQERPTPSAGAGEVLIEVTSVGVCGSDTHYYDHGRIGGHVVTAPMVLGHEAAGRIVAVGDGVDPARVGERVSIEPGVPCRSCPTCLGGRYNLCPQMVFHATPPIDGSLMSVIAHDAAFAHPVPEGVGDDAAAMVEPLSVGVWACRRARVGLGSQVLVTGAGPVGILAARVALAAGAARVLVADVNAERLAVAARGGIETLDLTATSLPAGLEASRARPDVLLECTGHPGVTADGVRVLAPAGTAVLIGMGGDEVALPLGALQDREVTVTGVFRYAGTWPTGIDLIASGRVAVDDLVTGHFGLDETAEALRAARERPGAIKSVIHPGR